MKLKILIVPIFIIAIVSLIIWGIIPAYSEFNLQSGILKNNQGKLDDIRGKQEKVASLFGELSSSANQQGILLKYLPASKQEEDLLVSLSSMAAEGGVLVLNLSISQEAKNTTAVAATSFEVGMPGNPDQAVVAIGPVALNFTAKMGIVGDYQKIKDFLNKAKTLQRFNSISSLNIENNTATGATTNTLLANIELNFNYLPKADSVPSFANDIFTKGAFDMSMIDVIKNRTTTELTKAEIAGGGSGTGKDNPFLP